MRRAFTTGAWLLLLGCGGAVQRAAPAHEGDLVGIELMEEGAQEPCPDPGRGGAFDEGLARLAVYRVLKAYQYGDTRFPDGLLNLGAGTLYYISNVRDVEDPGGPIRWVRLQDEGDLSRRAESAREGQVFYLTLKAQGTRGKGILLKLGYHVRLSARLRKKTTSLFGHWREYCVFRPGGGGHLIFVPVGLVITS